MVDEKMHFGRINLYRDVFYWACYRWDIDSDNHRLSGIGETWQQAYERHLYKMGCLRQLGFVS